jgi:hypothetical protein
VIGVTSPTLLLLLPPGRVGHDVHLQTTLEEMGPDSAVIFEFIHYKPKEGRNCATILPACLWLMMQ